LIVIEAVATGGSSGFVVEYSIHWAQDAAARLTMPVRRPSTAAGAQIEQGDAWIWSGITSLLAVLLR